MSLCSRFQIPASNTVGGVAETQTVLQCDMVKNMCIIQEAIQRLFPLCTCPMNI